jgi:hypothetical protein
MKRTGLFIVFVVSIASIVCADVNKPADVNAGASAQKSAQAAAAQTPAIVFESTDHNFGNVNPGSALHCEFKFTNKGSGMLEIKDVQPTCGCTVPELEKKKYEPGESGAIKVNFSPGSNIGSVTKLLYVISNDKVNPRLTLTLRANIIKKVQVNPEAITLSLKQPNAGCPDLTLSSLDGQAFAITGFQTSPDCINLAFDPNEKSASHSIKPVVDVEKLKKFLRGTIKINLNHPDCKEISVLFDAPSLFKADPPTLLLFNTEPLKPVTRDKIWLLSNYNEDFEIESTSSQKGTINVVSTEKVGPGRYMLKLEITPPKLPADAAATTATKSFTDLLTVKIKGGEKIDISCRGYYTKQKTPATASKK